MGTSRDVVARTCIVVASVLAVAIGIAPPAAANCVGPTITVAPGRVDRGSSLALHGESFGTSCNDVGVPPAGEGVLGAPGRNIRILLVQGDQKVLVARGDADEDYAFSTAVEMPATFTPGPAQVIVGGATGHQVLPVEIEVSDSPPTPEDPTSRDPAVARVTRFAGAGATAPTRATDGRDEGNVSPQAAVLLAGAGILFGIAAGVAATSAWARRRSAITANS